MVSRCRIQWRNDQTAKRVFELAEEGDRIAYEAFKNTGCYLGRLLLNGVATFDCEAIVLSGGLAEAGEILLGLTRDYFLRNVLSLRKGGVKILRSTLGNGDAPIRGASSLIRDVSLSPATTSQCVRE